MNKDNLMNVIAVKQLGYLLLDDSENTLTWTKGFSVILQFKLSRMPSYILLLEKQNFLKVEIIDGLLFVSGKGVIQKVYRLFVDEFSENDTKTISLIYRSGILRIMYGSNVLMLMEVKKEFVNEEEHSNSYPIRVAEYLNGYLAYVRIFDRALSTNEIIEQTNSLYLAENTPNLVKQLSAMHGKITCLPGDNKFDMSECYATNLVPCYSFDKFGNIVAINDTLVNPGGKVEGDCTKAYTVSAVIYFKPGLQKKYYIISNNHTSIDSGMSLYIQKEADGNYYVFAEHGNRSDYNPLNTFIWRVKSQLPIQAEAWTEITVTYGCPSLRLYINGSESNSIHFQTDTYLEQDSNIIIGDKQADFDALDDRNFSGYIKSIYIFDEALTAEECICVNMELAYRKETLVAAYEAQSFQEKNQVSETDIYLSRGVESILVEGSYPLEDLLPEVVTVNELAGNNPFLGYDKIKIWHEKENGKIVFKYLCPHRGEIVLDEIEDVDMSAETIWEIELILLVVIGAITCLTGLKVSSAAKNNIGGSLVKLVNTPSIKSAIQLFGKEVSWKTITYTFKAIYQAGFLRTLVLNLFELSLFNVLFILADIIAWVTGTKAIAIGTIITLTITGIILHFKRRPYIKLISVQFCHKPNAEESSVYIRSKFGEEEPVKCFNNNKERNNVLYLSNKICEQTYIVCEFEVRGDGGYAVKATCAQDNCFDSKSVMVSNMNTVVQFRFERLEQKRNWTERKEIDLSWTANEGSAQIKLGTTRHRIYLLPLTPHSPIVVNEAKQLENPYCQMLDIVFDSQRSNLGCLNLKTLADAIYNNEAFKYNGNNNISFIDGENDNTFCLKIRTIVEELDEFKNTGKTIQVNCKDVAILLYYLSCQFVNSIETVRVVGIGSTKGYFKCPDVQAIGSNSTITKEFENHFFVFDQYDETQIENAKVYDACLKYHKLVYRKEGNNISWFNTGELILPTDVEYKNEEQYEGAQASYIRGLTQGSVEIESFGQMVLANLGFSNS